MWGDSIDNLFFFASYDRLAQDLWNFAKPNSPTLKSPSTSESYGGSYRLKVGLITTDELVLAGEYFGLENDGYLNPGESVYWYWSMTPAAFYIGDASVWGESDYLNDIYVGDYFAVRPVINVTTENGFASGDGTSEKPYIIEG